jgi:hypothetical protein
MPDCDNCAEPIIEHGRNWIHTTGRFMCSTGSGNYAVPSLYSNDDAVTVALDDAYQAGYHDAMADGADGA